MRSYQPTLGVRETAQNIKFFVKAYNGLLWHIYKPLAIYIVLLHLFDALITGLFMSDSKSGFFLGSIIAAYFYTALAITWHRVVIYGADNYIPVDPFKPKKNELVFLGMGLLIGLFAFIIFFLIAISGVVLGQVFGQSIITAVISLIILVAAVFVLIMILYKFSFYFPAKAVDTNLTLLESFEMTNGYFKGLCFASFLASLKLILLVFCYYILVGALTVGLVVLYTYNSPELQQQIDNGQEIDLGVLGALWGFLITLPTILYFQPLFTAIGVTGLSNYYMHAMQNKTNPSTL